MQSSLYIFNKIQDIFNLFKSIRKEQIPENLLSIFIWHQVTPVFNSQRGHHRYIWTSAHNFRNQVEYLMSRFKILPLYKALEDHRRGFLKGHCAALTFDDGDASQAQYAFPILCDMNLSATFFINSAYLNSKRTFWFPVLNYFSENEDARRKAGLPLSLLKMAQKLRRTSDAHFYDEVRKKTEIFSEYIQDLPTRTVSKDWLSSLDGSQFAIGAHGHEHQRFSMMPIKWQEKDLCENVRVLSQFRSFRPVFAIPFGRKWDWTEDTIRIAHKQGLEVVLADGGINYNNCDFYNRIPCDGLNISTLAVNIMRKMK